MISLTVTVQQVWPWPKGGAVFTGKDDEGKHHRVLASRPKFILEYEQMLK